MANLDPKHYLVAPESDPDRFERECAGKQGFLSEAIAQAAIEFQRRRRIRHLKREDVDRRKPLRLGLKVRQVAGRDPETWKGLMPYRCSFCGEIHLGH